ncbi:MAG: trypsin-like peptidase domain-containing protein [Sedimentisphaerales bacterium]|nr:trypsin-like peptidase domain-containing protein [Sedimentisphaerales bacterium]
MKKMTLRILLLSVCLQSGCGKSIVRTTYTPIYAVLVGLTSGPEKEEEVVVDETKFFHQATGFLLDKTGLVVTNYHALVGYPNIRVFFSHKDRMFDAEVQLKDIDNDLAILALKDFNYEEIFSGDVPYSLKSSTRVQLSEEVFTLAFPLGKVLGSSIKFSDGRISSLNGLLDNTSLFQISNPIQAGSSGGPLFDSEGNLIGIALASADAEYFYEDVDVIPPDANFAIKSDQLSTLLSTLPESKEIMERDGTLKDKPTQEQVSAILPYVVSVYVK